MAAARLIATGVAVFLPIILVRALDQTTFGHYKQFFLVAMNAILLLSFTLPQSLYYFVPRSPESSQRYMEQTFLLLAGIGTLGGLLTIAARPALERFLRMGLGTELYLLALFIALGIPGILLSVAPMVDRRARLAGALLAVFEISRSLLIILAAVVFRSITAILAAACVTMALQTITAGFYIIWRRNTGEWNPGSSILKSQLAYSTPLAATGFVGLARDQLHAFFVGAAFTPAQFAIYAVGVLNIPLVNHVTQTLGEVLVLETSKNYAARKFGEMQRIWRRVVIVMALIVFPGCAMFQVYATDLIGLFYGAQYLEAVPIFRVYVLILPLSVLLLTSPLLRSTGDVRTMLFADLISLGFTVAAVIVLVRTIGLVGAAASLIIGNIVFGLVTSVRAATRLGLTRLVELFPWKELAVIGLVAIMCAYVPWRLLAAAPNPVRLIVGGSISGLLYLVAIFYGKLMDPDDRALILRVWNRQGRGRRRRPEGDSVSNRGADTDQ